MNETCSFCGGDHWRPDCPEIAKIATCNDINELKRCLHTVTAQRNDAIKEANRRDQKWMDGINEVLGEKLDYGDPCAFNAASSALEKWAQSKKHTFPDIGPDPLQAGKKDEEGVQAAKKRIFEAMSVQQAGVPDQTALVWRVDLSRLHGDHTWRVCHLPLIQQLEAELKELRKTVAKT